ncbi:uncharacterized protein RJT20DRAFT_124840, partial [Scheffersomyces xylosifermentans]|uniref:uncharacterized protein n=1 Tax=Scheffersomyces xylosifermentans TaxID=1304137 RepID=UPI00315D12A6
MLYVSHKLSCLLVLSPLSHSRPSACPPTRNQRDPPIFFFAAISFCPVFPSNSDFLIPHSSDSLSLSHSVTRCLSLTHTLSFSP